MWGSTVSPRQRSQIKMPGGGKSLSLRGTESGERNTNPQSYSATSGKICRLCGESSFPLHTFCPTFPLLYSLSLLFSKQVPAAAHSALKYLHWCCPVCKRLRQGHECRPVASRIPVYLQNLLQLILLAFRRSTHSGPTITFSTTGKTPQLILTAVRVTLKHLKVPNWIILIIYPLVK